MNSNEQTTQTLETLNDLITALSEGERTTYNHIIYNSNFQPNDFEKYISWSDECYTRNCIIDNEKFELILICWCAGHKTPIHDHGGEECWVKVIDGEFKETIYKPNENDEMSVVRTSISKVNEVSYMKDFMGFHCLENVAQKRSMSLHLYAKPIRTCRMFDESSKTYVKRDLNYDTHAAASVKI